MPHGPAALSRVGEELRRGGQEAAQEGKRRYEDRVLVAATGAHGVDGGAWHALPVGLLAGGEDDGGKRGAGSSLGESEEEVVDRAIAELIDGHELLPLRRNEERDGKREDFLLAE